MNSNSASIRDGAYWLAKLGETLAGVATFMALDRYGGAPDVEDRVSDALAAVVEGSHRFRPQPGKDGIGYYLQYVLSYVAGQLRRGASVAKGWSDEAVVFSDIAPEQMGIERLWELMPGGPDEEPDETLFVLNNGNVASTLEIVRLIAEDDERRAVAARLLGTTPEDPSLRVKVLQALDGLALQMATLPAWRQEPPEPEPVVLHDLDDVVMVRDGTQLTISAAEMREMVEAASRSSVVWEPDDAGVWYEDDGIPWAKTREAEATRSFRSPYADDRKPSRETERLMHRALDAWEAWSTSRQEVGTWPGAGVAILPALAGAPLPLDYWEQEVVSAMRALADAVADESEGVALTVAHSLAEELVSRGLVINSRGRLVGEFAELFGVDGTGHWDPVLPTAQGLRSRAEAWVEKVEALNIWPSQKAAIKALVLQGASPGEARAAARAAFARRSVPQTEVAVSS